MRGFISKSRSGFTLPELLISAAVLSIISVVLVTLYDGSYAAVNRGSGRLALQQRARETLKRISPVIISSFKDRAEADDYLIEFPIAFNTPVDNIVVTTTEDWLNPNYPDAATSSRMITDINNLNYFRHRIRLDNGNVVLEAGTWDRASSTFTANGNVRVLGRTDDPDSVDAVTISAIRFEKLAANAVRVELDVSVTIRNAAKAQEPLTETVQSILQIPNSSLRVPL